MGIGCFITIIASFVQAFAPIHKVGVFIFGRVLIGIGQGIALSEFQSSHSYHPMLLLTGVQPLAQSTLAKLHHLRYEKLLKSPA
jgi:MFS family permease